MILDATDRLILMALQSDARLPLKAIAARVGLARSSVGDRIRRLEGAGIIRGYRAEIAGEATAPLGAILSVRLRSTPDRASVAAITAMAEVRRCWSVGGEIDLYVELATDGAPALNAARDRIAALPGVDAVTTAIVLQVEKGA